MKARSCTRLKGALDAANYFSSVTHGQARDCEPDKVGLNPLPRLLLISSAAPCPPLVGRTLGEVFLTSAKESIFFG